MAARLTARFSATVTKPGRHGDGNGLYLLVKPSGAKSWVLRTVVHGRRCDIGLGVYALTGDRIEHWLEGRKVPVITPLHDQVTL